MFGPGESGPEGTYDADLMLAFRAVELNSLPQAGALEDQDEELLDLMMLAQRVKAKAEADAVKKAGQGR